MPGDLGAEQEDENLTFRLIKMIYLSFAKWYVNTTVYSVLMISLILLLLR